MTPSIEMRVSVVGRGIQLIYPKIPFKRHILKLASLSEGGQMTSISLRRMLSKWHGVSVGYFSYGSLLELGMADSGTKIGSYVSTGPNVRRIGAAHPLERPMLHPYWYNATFGIVDEDSDVSRTGCSIEDDVWLGANVTILPGCRTIGRGSVVGAGSVVTSNIPPFEVWAGVPAKKIGERLDPETRRYLASVDISSMSPSEVTAAIKAQLKLRTNVRQNQ